MTEHIAIALTLVLQHWPYISRALAFAQSFLKRIWPSRADYGNGRNQRPPDSGSGGNSSTVVEIDKIEAHIEIHIHAA